MRHGLLLVRLPPAARPEVEARLDRLAALLDSLGPVGWSRDWSPDGATLLASFDLDAGSPRWSWGERLPPDLATPGAVLAASDGALRALAGSHTCFAVDGDRARVVVGAGGPVAAFTAGEEGLGAWSTHATAAALVGLGSVEVDRDELPALLALGASLGAASHVRGVHALDLATVVDLPPGAGVRSFWPREERWTAEDPRAADGLARGALLKTVERRVGPERAPALALTAGRDSPVIAAACRLLGLEPMTFTFGEPEWPDVAGARAIAEAIGLRHEHLPLGGRDDPAEVRREAARDGLWADGLVGVGPQGAPALPPAMSAMVTGAGAEVARCYSYQAVARERRRPRPEHLLAVMDLPGRLPGAPPEAYDRAAAGLLGWLEDASHLARGGWHALDVLYTEQRVGRWAAARLPREHAAPAVVPFADPDLARLALSLPLDDRLRLGFHRRTVAAVAPGIALPDMQVQRRGLPAPLRRARRRARQRAAARSAAAALDAARRATDGGTGRDAAGGTEHGAPAAASAVGGPSSGAAAGVVPYPFAVAWEERPELRAWVADDLLADPVLADWLGDAWAKALRQGFEDADARHFERALLAAGLVLWARAATRA